ncbi:MAG TPA: hypothetical protein VLA76_12570 [Candidatus Angelobacter sp.]|nr:hypothetical protein [Candidatus Angelobacter sp.]
MDRWKAGPLAVLLALALAIAGCDGTDETNEDLMEDSTMPPMTDGI